MRILVQFVTMNDQKTDLLVDVDIEPTPVELNKDAKNVKTSLQQQTICDISLEGKNFFNFGFCHIYLIIIISFIWIQREDDTVFCILRAL